MKRVNKETLWLNTNQNIHLLSAGRDFNNRRDFQSNVKAEVFHEDQSQDKWYLQYNCMYITDRARALEIYKDVIDGNLLKDLDMKVSPEVLNDYENDKLLKKSKEGKSNQWQLTFLILSLLMVVLGYLLIKP